MTKIAIFDYGAGNIFSLKNALEKQGATVEVQTRVENLKGYDGIFLPGVGNFDPAIQSINRDSEKFLDVVGDTPVFGICLGMEMFFDKSQEGKEKGLGVIDGDVVVLPNTLKVPHMGWNGIRIQKAHPLLSGLGADDEFYFVHSYYPDPQDGDTVIATTDYGIPFASIVGLNNLFATQFHLEKSGRPGLKILDNFCKWTP